MGPGGAWWVSGPLAGASSGGAPRSQATSRSSPVGGRAAVTHLAVVERLGERATVVRARLETGRTHQIRIHLQSVGHPVLGDRKYGAPTDLEAPRMALHAARLGLSHPRTGAALEFESPWPSDLAQWLARLRQ